MKKVILILLPVTLLILVFNGCKKDADDDSALQPAGNYVITGSNNNFVQSYPLSVYTAQWAMDTLTNEWYYIDYLASTANLNAGVFVYTQRDTTTSWFALPDVYHAKSYSYKYNIALQTVTIVVAAATGGGIIGNPGDQTYKVVLIPSKMLLPNTKVDYKNYEEVARTYNLRNKK